MQRANVCVGSTANFDAYAPFPTANWHQQTRERRNIRAGAFTRFVYFLDAWIRQSFNLCAAGDRPRPRRWAITNAPGAVISGTFSTRSAPRFEKYSATSADSTHKRLEAFINATLVWIEEDSTKQ